MIALRDVEPRDRETVAAAAALHVKAFPGFFLPRLGPSFLRTLYTGYAEDAESGLTVAERDGRMVGFMAWSRDYSRFYRGLIRRHLAQFGWCSFCAVLRHPSFAKRLLRAFRKSDEVARTEKYVELASICADPEAGRTGVGSALIANLKERTDFTDCAYISLETDAEDNEAANRFYRKNGFRLARRYTTPEGRAMNEYRYAPEVQDETLVP